MNVGWDGGVIILGVNVLKFGFVDLGVVLVVIINCVFVGEEVFGVGNYLVCCYEFICVWMVL